MDFDERSADIGVNMLKMDKLILQFENDNEEKLLDMTLGESLDVQANRLSNQICIIEESTNLHITYKEFSELTSRLAMHLLELGVQKGDNVALYSTNNLEWVAVMYATAKIGACMVTVNTNFKCMELEHLLYESDAKVLIMNQGIGSNDYVSTINQICPELKTLNTTEKLHSKSLPKLEEIIYIGKNTPIGMKNMEELFAEITDEEKKYVNQIMCSLDKRDVACMVYTSGTTGTAKGVQLTHEGIRNIGKTCGYKMKLNTDDIECLPIPLFHCFGVVLAIPACITHGSAMVIIDKFEPVKVMKAIQRYKCTSLLGVPTMFIKMLYHPEFSNYDFSSLRTGIIGGAACSYEIARQIADKMYMKKFVIGLGLTEACAIQVMTDSELPLERRMSVVGKTLPHIENKIVDPETGETLKAGEIGEMCTRGYHLMKGYYKHPELTSKVIDSEGWLHSGDLCRLESDGNYVILGRIKDMIIRGGENVFAKELENVIQEHPAIKDVSVVGIPEEKYGEDVVAFVIKKKEFDVTDKEIIDYVHARVASYKTPQYVLFVEEMPLTANGKILKRELRKTAINILR
ncbi:MAG: AMP-binding protein [Lachnospiraceae bacterium]|nr:AMP-binding protein [Lachnospiraceae bacterium]